MKKFSYILFWIFADTLLIFGITFLPSLFSIFCFITAILFIPIEDWQKILKKVFTKPILSLIIAVCIAFVIAKFPITQVVTNINKIINPPPTSSDFKIYYEELEMASTTSEFENSSTITTTSSQSTSSENLSSNQKLPSSSQAHSSKPKTSSNESSSSKINSSSKLPSSSKKPSVSSNTVTSQYVASDYFNNAQSNTVTSFETTPEQTTENNNEPTNNAIYRTPSGKRYHNSPTCGGKNSYEVSIEEAINDGLTPCKKCVK